MNFLAHALLAGDDPAMIVGGVTGDWIKGPLPGALPDDLARGVALHRAIDDFAETQTAFRRSRARVSEGRKRYSGVLVDVYYDHLLARNWAAVHHLPLKEYCASIYGHIRGRMHELPADSHPALERMADEDWLTSYASLEGLAAIFVRMSRRVRHPETMLQAEQELMADAEGFTEDFDEWFGEMREFCRRWREKSA